MAKLARGIKKTATLGNQQMTEGLCMPPRLGFQHRLLIKYLCSSALASPRPQQEHGLTCLLLPQSSPTYNLLKNLEG